MATETHNTTRSPVVVFILPSVPPSVIGYTVSRQSEAIAIDMTSKERIAIFSTFAGDIFTLDLSIDTVRVLREALCHSLIWEWSGETGSKITEEVIEQIKTLTEDRYKEGFEAGRESMLQSLATFAKEVCPDPVVTVSYIPNPERSTKYSSEGVHVWRDRLGVSFAELLGPEWYKENGYVEIADLKRMSRALHAIATRIEHDIAAEAQTTVRDLGIEMAEQSEMLLPKKVTE
jgi:hypothetical protein